jgi:hypothetical protein
MREMIKEFLLNQKNSERTVVILMAGRGLKYSFPPEKIYWITTVHG